MNGAREVNDADNPRRGPPGAGFVQRLRLAASPTFAIMALTSAGPMEMLGNEAHASLLSGMVPMYLLMSLFHSDPWLNLMANRRHA